MKNERLNPLNDYLFLKYMGEPGDEEQLLAFLNVLLYKTGREEIASLKIEASRAFSADIIGDKASILDLRAEMPDGTRVNIEVQLRRVGNMDKRSLFYWSREYARGIEAGQDYRKLPKVIAINIIDMEFIPIDEIHTCFHLCEDNHKDVMLTDTVEIHFICMSKFRRLKEIDIVNNPLHRWLAFFDKRTNKKTLKKIIKMDTGIAKAQEKIQFVLQDKEALHTYQMREMAMSDYTSGVNSAHQEGIAIGEQRGIAIGEQRGIAIGEQQGIAIGEQRGITTGIVIGEQKALAKYVLRLASKGITVENIVELTGLSPKEVRRILK